MISDLYLLSVRYLPIKQLGGVPDSQFVPDNQVWIQKSSDLNIFKSRFEAKEINEIARGYQK